MNKTSIQWTTFTSNPIKFRRKADNKVVWGCVKTSPGCSRCYAEAIALRFDRGRLFNAKNMEELTVFLDEDELRQLLTRKTCDGVPVSGSRVFLADMTDAFGEWVPDEMLDRLFAVMALRPDVTFQILTKRAERMARYWSDGYRNGRGEHTSMYVERAMHTFTDDLNRLDECGGLGSQWPNNIHAGVSVENQRETWRLGELANCSAPVTFCSAEPLLGGLDLRPWLTFLHWVIVGCESGRNRRPWQIEWDLAIERQCRDAGVPFFRKQVVLDEGKVSGEMAEWPEGWRVRQWPEVVAANQR